MTEAPADENPRGEAPAPPAAAGAVAADGNGLDALLADARIWRGRQTQAPHRLRTVPTGWPALDGVLPGNGWPVGALTEVLIDVSGRGELSLLLPALARLTDAYRENAWVAWVAPPHVPYAPALAAAGVRLERMLVIDAAQRPRAARRRSSRPAPGSTPSRSQMPARHGDSDDDALWAAEQTLRSGLCAAVVGWFRQVDDRALRRLQLAAQEGRAWGVAFRPAALRTHASPASLRIAIDAAPTGRDIVVDIVKCRGMAPRRVHCRLAD